MSNQQRGGFHFMHLTHPNDAEMWRREVRSHAARNSPARQQRVIRYQSEKFKLVKTRNILEANSLESCHISRSNRPDIIWMPEISNALSAARSDPFDTYICQTTRFENFLLDYFVNYIVRQAAICFIFRTAAEEAKFRQAMATHWLQIAASDAGMLAAIFLAACRHLSENHHLQGCSTLALQYKGQCISALNTSITQEGAVVSDLTITKTLALASEDIITGDYAASNRHLDAARKMVATRRSSDTLGINTLLRRLVLWFVKDPSENGNSLLTPFICVKNTRRFQDELQTTNEYNRNH